MELLKDFYYQTYHGYLMRLGGFLHPNELQRTWEINIDWDDFTPDYVAERWKAWRSELPILMSMCLERCYFLKAEILTSTEMWHGFCDASEEAYAAVVYLRSTYTSHMSHLLWLRPRLHLSNGNLSQD